MTSSTISVNLRQLFSELHGSWHEQPTAEWFSIKDFATANSRSPRTCERSLRQCAERGLLDKKLFFVKGRMMAYYRKAK